MNVSPNNVPLPGPHLITLALAEFLDRWRQHGRPSRRGPLRLVGWSLLGVGGGVAAAAVTAAGKTDLADPDRLVVHGPYTHSRNPMYLGWASMHLGAGLVTRSGWMLAGVPVAVALIHREVLGEERSLAATFGEAFERYQAAVPRYLPRWR